MPSPYDSDPVYSPIEVLNSQGNSMPGESMGPDYSGTIPPPPSGQYQQIPPQAYEPMMAAPANQLGLSMGHRASLKRGCGILCLALLGAVGAHFGRKKHRKGVVKHLVGAGAGIAAVKVVPGLEWRPAALGFGLKAAVAFGGGWAAGRYVK